MEAMVKGKIHEPTENWIPFIQTVAICAYILKFGNTITMAAYFWTLSSAQRKF
jgi:hypothetical protein